LSSSISKKFEFNGKSPLVLGKPASSNAEALEFVVWKFNHAARSADKASACCNTFWTAASCKSGGYARQSNDHLGDYLICDEQATSVSAWRRHRSAIAARLVYLREIDRTAFWEFLQQCRPKADIGAVW
jgi:hypothetical protein